MQQLRLFCHIVRAPSLADSSPSGSQLWNILDVLPNLSQGTSLGVSAKTTTGTLLPRLADHRRWRDLLPASGPQFPLL